VIIGSAAASGSAPQPPPDSRAPTPPITNPSISAPPAPHQPRPCFPPLNPLFTPPPPPDNPIRGHYDWYFYLNAVILFLATIAYVGGC
jgi:hypothetical protein